MCFAKKKKYKNGEDPVEQKFDAMMSLIKDLPRADYNRLCDAMDMAYNAYQKVRNVKTIDEKAVEDISDTEKELNLIETKEN